MPAPRPRQRRALDGLMALVVGGAIGAVATPAAAAPAEDWSLEHRRDDPKLVSQRMGKLQRNPFDGTQWRALSKALGARGLADRIRKAHRARPKDVALRILMARVLEAEGDPAGAAAALAEVEPDAGHWRSKVFEQRIQWLRDAGEHRAAAEALMAKAAGASGTSKTALLLQAHEIAERGDLHDLALSLARTLAAASASDSRAQLRLARAAASAGEGDEADRAYEQVVRHSRGRERDDAIAERARARMNTDNPTGASELLWSLLEDPGRGAKAVREGWWDQLADAHRRAGTTDLLVAKLGTWLGTHPGESAAWRTLAQAQETAGFDATDAWKAVLDRAPRDVESHTALVEALEDKGKVDAAIEEYGRLIGRHPGEVELGLDLANRLVVQGERERGMELAADIEARIARKPKALLQLLDFYNLNDEAELALAVARKVVALRPRSADARVALGEQLYQMNRIDDALEQWAMLPKLVRPGHRGWAKHAEILSEHGRTSDAVSSLKRALEREPENPGYLRLRAMLAEDQRRFDTALRLWQQVRELAVGRDQRLLRDEARTRMVELLVGGSIPRRRLKLEQTERDAHRLLEDGAPLPDAIEAGRLLAELYTRQENYTAAVTVQQRLFELDPDDPDRLADLAAAQRRAGQVESALGTLEDLLSAEPTRSADTLAEMSELAFEAGDADRALDAASQAAHKDRTRVDALIHLGELHERRGDIEEARRAYRGAIEADAHDARARLKLAELALTLGDTERSAEAFREILDLGGPPELVRTAGRRALDLAEASGSTRELFDLAVERTIDKPEADEPRQFLLDALDRVPAREVESWLREGKAKGPRSGERVEHLRRPLVVALGRGSVGTRLRAAEHLGRLDLPETALPLAKLGATLHAPRDATATVRNAFDRTRVTALEAAGRLRDRQAVPQFRDVLTDPSQSQSARHAAAWALAGVGGQEAGEVLARYVESGYDPMLASLGCLVLAELPRKSLDNDVTYAITSAARDNANATVRHACAYAEAALTPDGRVERLHAQLRVSDPVQAAIAAWRIGQLDEPDAPSVQALLEAYLGPAGLARDAAAAGLVTLLDGSVHDASSRLPAPASAGAWSTTIDRWLKARVAPRVEPLPASALQPWVAQVQAAQQTAAEGTRAERDAAQRARCEAADGSPTTPGICLTPLVEGPIQLPARD